MILEPTKQICTFFKIVSFTYVILKIVISCPVGPSNSIQDNFKNKNQYYLSTKYNLENQISTCNGNDNLNVFTQQVSLNCLSQ